MTDFAYAPDTGFIRRGLTAAGTLFVPSMDKYNDPAFPLTKGQTKEYRVFFWRRTAILNLMLFLPWFLIDISLFFLLGYLLLLLVPVAIRTHNKNVHYNAADKLAYGLVSKLKLGWKDHGETFYRQIWNHDCNGALHDHSYCYNNGCKNPTLKCQYCERRLVEIKQLLASQNSVEVKASGEVDNVLFESSQEFRKAVAERAEVETEAMQEISASVLTPRR